MTGRTGTVRGLAILGGGTVLAALLGLGFQSLLAYRFGATAETDAFFMSLSIYGFLGKFLMLSHLRSLALPVYARVRASSPEGARKLAGGLLGLSTAAVAVLALALLLAAPFLVDALAPGYQGPTRALTVRMVRILIPALVFLAGTTIAMSLLESERRFGITISAQKIVPAGASLALLLLAANRFGITAVAWIDLFASGAGALLILPVLRGRVGSPALGAAARDPELRRIGRRWLGLSSSNAATFVGEWAFRVGASLLPAGLFSAVLYGRMVHDLLHGAINDSAQTVSLPRFADALAREDGALAPALRSSLAALAAVSLPLALLVAATAPWSVALLFGRGRFLADGGLRPAAVGLALFMIGFFLQGLVQILFSAAFAAQRSELINRVQLVGHLVRAAALVPLAYWFSYVGLVGAQVGMNALVLSLLVLRAPREWGLRDLPRRLARPLVAAAVPALLYLALAAPRLPDPMTLGTLGRLGVMAAIGVAWGIVYGALALLLGLREVELLRRLLGRRAATAAGVALVAVGAGFAAPGRAAAQSWAPLEPRSWVFAALEWREARGEIPVGAATVRPLPAFAAALALASLGSPPEHRVPPAVLDFARRFAEERGGGASLAAGLAAVDADEPEGARVHPFLRAEVGASRASGPFAWIDLDRTTLVRGGVGVKVGNLWLAAARDRVQLGGGATGATVLNPGAHLDGVQVGTAAPTRLGPLGPVSAVIGVGPMPAYEAVDGPWWGFLRATAAPAPWIRLGLSRAVLVGGHFPGGSAAFDPKPYGPDVGSLGAADALRVVAALPTRFDDQIAAVDVRVAWSRLGLPVVTYGEVGWEDADRSWGDPALVAGVLWAAASPLPVTVRYEYAAFGRDARVCGWCDTLPAFWYQHVRFQSGWRAGGELLGHPLGGYGHQHALALTGWLDHARIRAEVRASRLVRRRWNLLEAGRPGSAGRLDAAASWRAHPRLELLGTFGGEAGEGWSVGEWRIGAAGFF